MGVGAIAPRANTNSFLAQSVEVNISSDDLRILRKALRLNQGLAVFKHSSVTIPGKVGGGFPWSSRRIQVSGNTAG
jgi:hypothetical protein